MVRHGASTHQEDRVFAARDAPLSRSGELQIRELGTQLQAGPPIDLMISSPLLRACQSAEVLADVLGMPLDAVEVWPLVTERRFGPLEGGTPLGELLGSGALTYEGLDRIAGVETLESVYRRATATLQELIRRPASRAVVVGHGMFGRALRRVGLGLDHRGEYADGYDYRQDYLENGAAFEITVPDSNG
jgi:probable phosphoglycerate mutase